MDTMSPVRYGAKAPVRQPFLPFSQLFIELAEWHRPLYVVIDDYHLITNPVIHESMRFFLRHQPENLTLVVPSRNPPQLGIANLRVRDQLFR